MAGRPVVDQNRTPVSKLIQNAQELDALGALTWLKDESMRYVSPRLKQRAGNQETLYNLANQRTVILSKQCDTRWSLVNGQ